MVSRHVDMLQMQAFQILPVQNNLPDTYTKALRLINCELIQPIIYDVCSNDGTIFKGEHMNDTHCLKCGAERGGRKFYYLTLQDRIKRWFKSTDMSRLIQSHMSTQETDSNAKIYDIHQTNLWQMLYSEDGYFKGDSKGLSFSMCTDGVNPFSHNKVQYSTWLIVLTLLNLPRQIRYHHGNMLLLGIIPGNDRREVANLSPFLEVVVDELLSMNSMILYDGYLKEEFALKRNIINYVLDYLGIGKVMNVSGSGAYQGCLWCGLKGM